MDVEERFARTRRQTRWIHPTEYDTSISLSIYGGMPAPSSRSVYHNSVLYTPPSPVSELLNPALEIDSELMDGHIAQNSYTQEPRHRKINYWSTQTTTEEFLDDFISPQYEGGNISHTNSLNNDQFNQFNRMPLVTQCETPSLADLERNVNPFSEDMTYETLELLKNDIQCGTPGILLSSPCIQCSQAGQLSINVSKDTVVSNLCSDYPNLCSQVVPGPEVVKQRQSTKKELKLPKGEWLIHESTKAMKKEQSINSCDHCKNEKFPSYSNQLEVLFDRQAKWIKKQDKKNSELIKQFEEQNKKLQILEEQNKKSQILFEEQNKKLQILEEQNKKSQILFEEQNKKLQIFEERCKRLNNRLSAAEGDVTGNSNSIEWLSREQNAQISSILKPTVTWSKALNKILTIVFSKKTLSESCSVGKKNAKNKPLDPMKLDVVKRLILDTYGSSNEITNEAINVTVNNCCSGARRYLSNHKL